MIHQLIKIMWKQRTKNSWIILELFLVFILMWCLIDPLVVLGLTRRNPVGIDIENVYRVKLSVYQEKNPNYIPYEKGSTDAGENFLRVIQQIQQHPEVTDVAYTNMFPLYSGWYSGGDYGINEVSFYLHNFWASPVFFNVFNLPDIPGFLQPNHIVITKNFAEDIFPDARIGEQITIGAGGSTATIAGFTEPMKRHDFARYDYHRIYPILEQEVYEMDERTLWSRLIIYIRVKPGVDSNTFASRFKENMDNQLKIGNFFLSDVISLSKIRHNYLEEIGIYDTIRNNIQIGVFFLVNIFLAVVGTFWLRISKRKSELALRMALGAERKTILWQMLSESYILFFAACIPAILVCINLINTDVLSLERMDFTMERFLWDTLLTFAIFFIAITLATLYPAYRSSQIQPAEALRDE